MVVGSVQRLFRLRVRGGGRCTAALLRKEMETPRYSILGVPRLGTGGYLGTPPRSKLFIPATWTQTTAIAREISFQALSQ